MLIIESISFVSNIVLSSHRPPCRFNKFILSKSEKCVIVIARLHDKVGHCCIFLKIFLCYQDYGVVVCMPAYGGIACFYYVGHLLFSLPPAHPYWRCCADRFFLLGCLFLIMVKNLICLISVKYNEGKQIMFAFRYNFLTRITLILSSFQ